MKTRTTWTVLGFLLGALVIGGCSSGSKKIVGPGADGTSDGSSLAGDVFGDSETAGADGGAGELGPEDVFLEDTFPSDAVQDVQADIPVEIAAGCCVDPEGCPEGEVCILDDSISVGFCVGEMDDGSCFHDSDCFGEELCIGEWLFECTENSQPQAGFCAEVPDWCCMTDDECDDGLVCQGVEDGEPGSCEQAPGPGECYGDEDCAPDEECMGAGTCACFMDCYWVGPGHCELKDPPVDCCLTDGDCLAGEVCVGEGAGGFSGTCHPAAGAGECWYDSDCGAGAHCEGESICA